MEAKIILKKQHLPFTQIPNNLLCNNQASGLAKSLWCVLYSKPDNWTFYWKEIENNFKEGKNALRTAAKQLEILGYLKKEQKKVLTGRGKETKFGGMQISLLYDPSLPLEQENQGKSLCTDFVYPRNVTSRYEDTRNRYTYKDLTNKDLLKKDLKNIFLEKFKIPAIEEIKSFFNKNQFYSQPEEFFDHFNANGWKSMKNWESAARNWEIKYKRYNPDKIDINKNNQPKDSKHQRVSAALTKLKNSFEFHNSYYDFDDFMSLAKFNINEAGGLLMYVKKGNMCKVKNKYNPILTKYKIEVKN